MEQILLDDERFGVGALRASLRQDLATKILRMQGVEQCFYSRELLALVITTDRSNAKFINSVAYKIRQAREAAGLSAH